MRFDKEELGEILVGMFCDVCNTYEECKDCPLYNNCEYYVSIKTEVQNWLLVQEFDKK